MKNSANRIRFWCSLVVALCIFNAIAWLIPFQHAGSFWIGYSFTMAAIALSFAVSFYAFHSDNRQSKFYGLPLAVIVWAYMILQCIAGIVLMTASSLATWISALICIIPLCLCLLGLIAMDSSKNYAEKQDESIRAKVTFIKGLSDDVQRYMNKVSDEDMRQELYSLNEIIRYADPISSSELASLEAEVCHTVKDIGFQLSSGNIDSAKHLIVLAKEQMIERNQKCKILK